MATDPQGLGRAAYDRQPVFFMDEGMAWEQRLALAYDEAAGHVRSALPTGTQVDLAEHALAADMAGQQLTDRSSVWRDNFLANQDAPLASGVGFGPDKSRAYYLGQFAQASSNIGAFITGYAREQVSLGAFSQDNFNSACDIRLRSLSDIIYLGRTGKLRAVLDPEGWAAANGGSSSSLVIATPGVYTNAAGASLQGLGVPVPLIIGIVVVGVLVAAGYGAAMYFSAENEAQRRAGLEICQDAVRRSHPEAAKICGTVIPDPSELPSVVDKIISPETQNTVILYGAIGLGVMLLINFAPNIMMSLSRTGEVYSSEKIRRLRQLEESGGGNR